MRIILSDLYLIKLPDTPNCLKSLYIGFKTWLAEIFQVLQKVDRRKKCSLDNLRPP